MIITLTVIAFLVQFGGLYVLLRKAQRAHDASGEAVKVTNQRGHQAYYDAFSGHTVERRKHPRIA